MGLGWVEHNHDELAQYVSKGTLTMLMGAAFFGLGLYNTFLANDTAT